MAPGCRRNENPNLRAEDSLKAEAEAVVKVIIYTVAIVKNVNVT